jgi:replicative DNA helicase
MAIGPMSAGRIATAAAPAGNGLLALRAMIDRGAGSEFQHLSEDVFLADERRHFDFVRNFYQSHGMLPTLDVMNSEGLRLQYPATAPVSYYVQKLYERAQYNIAISTQPQIVQALQAKDMDAFRQHVTALHHSVTHYTADQDLFTLEESLRGVLEEYERAALNPGIQGVTLGWDAMDDITGGAVGGDVVTLVGRPGEGKSWLLTYMARQARLAGKSVLFVSNEMMHFAIARRFLGLESGVNPDFIRRGQLSVWGRDAMYAGVARSATGAPFHLISGSFKKTVAAVDAAIIELSPDVVYIDASYLMKPVRQKNSQAKHEMLSEVGEEIKNVAMRRNKPIIQSVQFNRSAKKEKDGHKDGANIGGTDTVLQISTVVVSLAPGEGSDAVTTRDLTLLKNREGGAVCNVKVNFLFSPPNFSHIPANDNDERVGEDGEAIREVHT